MSKKCLVVDDEKLARQLMEDYIGLVPELTLLYSCKNAIEALDFLRNQQVDLLFLDINMPNLNGLELMQVLEYRPKIILTTAYADYALESYEYGVVDYLLKPIPFARFLKGVNRALNTQTEVSNRSLASNELSANYLEIKQDGLPHQIPFSEIKYIKGLGNYLQIFTIKRKFTIYETLSRMEELLPSGHFMRTHKSYIVSLHHISKIQSKHILLGKIELPLSPMYKRELMTRMQQLPKR